MATIFVLDDHFPSRERLKSALSFLGDVHAEPTALDLIWKIEMDPELLGDLTRIAVTDLVVSAYWTKLRDGRRKPVVMKSIPLASPTEANPEGYPLMVLDYVKQFLEPLKSKYSCRLVVFTYFFKFIDDLLSKERIEKKELLLSQAEQVRAELHSIGIEDAQIIDKEAAD